MSLEAPCVSEDLSTFFAIFKDHIANYRLTYIVGSEEVIVQFSRVSICQITPFLGTLYLP